ncbi:MAG: BTAD domain-containing putative transcriptional regulator [Ardenticatenaceae bacterium]|nr:BTAD domain-containing putative transcriptional regulator [Ardenticatenaceae bacterium]
MERIHISLFGKLLIEVGGDVINGFDSSKLSEFFCFLLVYRDRPHSRDKLANLLWSNLSTSKSKTYLRKTLWQLQTILDDPDFLSIEPEWIQINKDAPIWLDVAILENAFNHVKGVQGHQLDSLTMEQVRQATDLYRGDLLEGWYLEWCLHERERLQNIYLILLEKLMGYCESHGEIEEGFSYGMQVLAYNQARERTHRRLMRLFYSGGYRTDALRQYERCVDILRQELGVQPSKQTVLLYNQIKADHFVTPSLPRQPAQLPINQSAAQLNNLLDSLNQLNDELEHIQQQVQQKIDAVKFLIKE